MEKEESVHITYNNGSGSSCPFSSAHDNESVLNVQHKHILASKDDPRPFTLPSTDGKSAEWEWPKHITAEWFKRSGNAFVGADQTIIFKSMLSIKSFIGIGMLISLFLPWKLSLTLACILLVPPLVRTLLIKSNMMVDKNSVAHPIIKGDYTAALKGDFCLLLIGARAHTTLPSSEFKWLGERFNDMVRELESAPEENGFLGGDSFLSTNPYIDGPMMVQYWRSQEHLNKWAKSALRAHLKPMIESRKHISQGNIYGFWHESYHIHAGEYDTVYSNMSRVLFGKVGDIYPLTGKLRAAAGRANLQTQSQDEANDAFKAFLFNPIDEADKHKS